MQFFGKWHPLFLSLPLESVIKGNQQRYYQALADDEVQSTPFIDFMLSVIAQILVQNAPVSAPINISALKTPQVILSLVKENQQVTRQQMAERTAKDIRTIGRAIAKLQKAGKLKRIGSDKAGYWEIVTDE